MPYLSDFLSGNILIPDAVVEYKPFENRTKKQMRKAEKLASIFWLSDGGYVGYGTTKDELFDKLAENGIISDSVLGRLKGELMLQTGFYSFCFGGPGRKMYNWYEFNSSEERGGEKIYRLERKEKNPE